MYKIYRLIGCATLGLAAITLLNSCEETKAGTENEKEENAEMFIYELESQSVSSKSFMAQLQKFVPDGEFSRELIQSDDKRSIGYYDEKNDSYFDQDMSTGNLSFNRGIQKYLGDYAPALPAQKDAEGIAMDFLKQNKFITGENNEMKLLHSGGLRADPGKNGKVIDKMRTVTFGRTIDGVAVMGSGSKIVVNIGDKSEITGLVHKWRNINTNSKRAVSKDEMVSKDEAKEQFNKLVLEQFGKDSKAKIDEFNLIYYDGDGKYIQPMYGVRATIIVQLDKGKTNEIPYMTFVHALKQPVEELTLFSGSIEGKKTIKREKEDNGTSNSEGMD